MPDEDLGSGATLVDDRASERETSTGVTPPPILAGRYEIESLLGVGGMGAVYRARDRELDEPVALKMLRRELLAMPGILERFRTEVKAARKVTSPHVARTFDIGEDGGERFLTMELVDGGSLASEMERHPGGMPIARVVAIADQVCAGLAAAHGASVVHRDLKPDNVLFTKDGAAKITDFGIAKIDADVRMTHGSVGTPAYMAPEQVTGEPIIDLRADLYALGVMLFEMLATALPWKGESVFAIASARLLASPPDVRALRPEIPRPLGDLVTKLLTRDKAGRPASADEVRAALAAIDPMRRPTAPPPSRSAPPPRAAIPARSTTVAVLPFTNRGAADDAYLGDAIADEIIDALSMSRGLRVFARGAVIAYASTTRDARDIGRDIGAHVVVHGTLQRNGDRVRASARMVSVADGLQLWAAREDRPFGDLLEAGSVLARGIATALAVEARDRHIGPRDPIALELYVRGRRAYFGADAGGRHAARSYFRQAFERAPQDPSILAGLAVSSVLAASPEELASTAKLVEDAVAAAPESSDVQFALATVRLHQSRIADAARATRTALELAPSSADAHLCFGSMLNEAKRFDAALPHLELARELDPSVAAALFEIGRLRALLDGPSAGIDVLESVTPGGRGPMWWLARLRLAIWRDAREADDLIADVRGTDLADSPLMQSVLATLTTGKWNHAPNATSRRRAFAAQLMAEMAASRGRTEEAIEHIVGADAACLFDIAWLDLCPVFAAFRDDPRVQRARVGIAARAEEVAAILGS